MDDLSMTSVLDLQFSSEGEEEDEEISLMAKCVEMEMSAPIPIPGLSCAVRSKKRLSLLGFRATDCPRDRSPQDRCLTHLISLWEEGMDQYSETTGLETVTLLRYAGT